MDNEVLDKPVGFLESAISRKSNSRLTVFLCAIICIWAAAVEGSAKLLSVAKDRAVEADWTAIAILVGTLLLGNGALKVAQRIGVNKKVEDDTAA